MLISLSQAARLCNKSELKLFASSLPAEIWKLTDAQIETSIKRARGLKDKWSALTREQVRSKQSAEMRRSVKAGGQSDIKAQLFSEALDRFLKAKASAKPDVRETKSRTKGREGPAGVRDYLKKKRAIINTDKRPTRGGAGVKPVASRPAASESVKTPAAGASRSTKPAKPKSKPKASPALQASMLRAVGGDSTPAALLPAAIAQPHLKLGKPVKTATARAKQRAIAKSGLTKRRAHVAARGRRAQGKRDAR